MLAHRPIPPFTPATRSSLAARVEALEADRDRLRTLAHHLVGALEELTRLASVEMAPGRPVLRLVRGDADQQTRAL